MNPDSGAPPLVHGLFEAQSILPVWLGWVIEAAIILFWIGLLILIAVLILKRFLSEPAQKPAVFDFNRNKEFGTRLDTLEQEYLANGNYREGIHKLSELMRRHWSETQSFRIRPLTSHEMDYFFKSENPAELFYELNDWQFSRREPNKQDFKDALRRVRDVHSDRLKAKPGLRRQISRIMQPVIPVIRKSESQNRLDALLERKE